MYIEPWMVLTVGLVGAFGAIAYMLYTHHIADKTNDNLVNHIQDIKENPNIPDNVKQLIKQSLTEWNSKYVGDKISKADDAVEKYIKAKLKDYGRL
jgi:non-homologous end joining protein Ku